MSERITIRELGCRLAWAAYMTHCLLDGIDLRLHEEDRKRLVEQAKEDEIYGVSALQYKKEQGKGTK